MNDTGICWADKTWNPIVGCDGPDGKHCDYCYAYKLRGRLGSVLDCDDCREFRPHLHPERLSGRRAPAATKTPQLVFADSMGDWWGENVHRHWRRDSLRAMNEAPWHTYVILTKRPDLIWFAEIDRERRMNRLPPNLWLGVSVTGKDDWWRVDELGGVIYQLNGAARGLVSVEPLTGIWDNSLSGVQEIDWVIIGPQSGPGGKIVQQPTFDAQRNAREWAERCGAMVWEKDGLVGGKVQRRPGVGEDGGLTP